MEEIPVNRAYLETLTTAGLIRMADNYGIDIPPGLDRVFIIEEVLEAVSFDSPGSGDPALALEPEPGDSGPKESVPLPKQYNFTFIDVMIRDPQWAFVFWEVKSSDRETYERAQEFEGYYLQVSPFDGQGPAALSPPEDGVFTVPVRPGDGAWYLGLSPAAGGGVSGGAGRRYRVELCAGMRGGGTVLAASSPFSLPGFPGAGGRLEAAGACGHPLAGLSGYGDFQVLRSGERQMRVKKDAAASHE